MEETMSKYQDWERQQEDAVTENKTLQDNYNQVSGNHLALQWL